MREINAFQAVDGHKGHSIEVNGVLRLVSFSHRLPPHELVRKDQAGCHERQLCTPIDMFTAVARCLYPTAPFKNQQVYMRPRDIETAREKLGENDKLVSVVTLFRIRIHSFLSRPTGRVFLGLA